MTFGHLFAAAYESRWRQAAASAVVTEEMACEYELSLLALEDIKALTDDDITQTHVALVEWLMGYVIAMRLREILPVSSLRNAMRSGATSVVEILTIMSDKFAVSRDCYDELERCLKGWQMRLLAL